MGLILVVLLAALSPPQQATPPLSHIEGVITSAAGEPLSGARIILRRDGSVNREAEYGTVTGTNGKFAFRDIVAGRYRLTATMPGYVRREYGQRRPNGPSTILDLTVPQLVRDLKLSLIPGSTIAGRVYDQDGRPVQRATIQALVPRYVKGIRTLILGATAQTDDLGDYRMYWINPGQYFLLATPSRPASDDAIPAAIEQFDGSEEIYPPVFYPNAIDETGARPLRLDPGAELRGVDFILTRVRAVRVGGRVVDSATRALVPGANVSIRMGQAGIASASITLSTRSDLQGNFELRRVVPGTYTLHAINALPASQSAMVRREIQVGDKDIAGLEIALQPPLFLNGRVTIEGTPDKLPERRMSVALTPMDGIGGYGASVQPDGTFVINAVEPNVYRIEVSGLPGTFYVRSARLGRNDVLQNGMDLREGVAESLDLSIATGAGTVEGAVIDEQQKPVPGAQVVLVPAIQNRSRFDLFRTTTTDQAGRFTIQGAVPGDYKLFAWEDLEPGDYFNPTILEQYETRGTQIRIEERGRATATLKTIQ